MPLAWWGDFTRATTMVEVFIGWKVYSKCSDILPSPDSNNSIHISTPYFSRFCSTPYTDDLWCSVTQLRNSWPETKGMQHFWEIIQSLIERRCLHISYHKIGFNWDELHPLDRPLPGCLPGVPACLCLPACNIYAAAICARSGLHRNVMDAASRDAREKTLKGVAYCLERSFVNKCGWLVTSGLRVTPLKSQGGAAVLLQMDSCGHTIDSVGGHMCHPA